MFALLFGAVSLLYTPVGKAGGTALLALMALASFPSNELRPTASLLNIVGLRRLSQIMTLRVLAAILSTAGIQLLLM